jgi:hypothetical protein
VGEKIIGEPGKGTMDREEGRKRCWPVGGFDVVKNVDENLDRDGLTEEFDRANEVAVGGTRDSVKDNASSERQLTSEREEA